MRDDDIHKLAGLFEDSICSNIDLDEFEDIMPKIATVLYNRYCVNHRDVLPPIKKPR